MNDTVTLRNGFNNDVKSIVFILNVLYSDYVFVKFTMIKYDRPNHK